MHPVQEGSGKNHEFLQKFKKALHNLSPFVAIIYPGSSLGETTACLGTGRLVTPCPGTACSRRGAGREAVTHDAAVEQWPRGLRGSGPAVRSGREGHRPDLSALPRRPVLHTSGIRDAVVRVSET